MDFTQLLTLAFVLKIAVLIVLLGYIIFTIVVFVQVRTMNRLISVSVASTIISVLSVIHILLALALFVITLAIL
jgi:hypothetical protein